VSNTPNREGVEYDSSAMTPKWMDIIDQLKGQGIDFAPALTDADVVSIERKFSFRFPPDLRALLQTAVAQGEQFPDWRSGSEAHLRDWLAIPREGIFFDIEHNNFWLTEWGPKPESIQEALQFADRLLAAAPKLIPIYAHRMIPDDPHSEGNPVFSVHQTDIIYYGYDLEDYLRHEFGLPGRKAWPENLRSIRFWDIERFQEVRWAKSSCVFDNRRNVEGEG
jgi:hypothetical protein